MSSDSEEPVISKPPPAAQPLRRDATPTVPDPAAPQKVPQLLEFDFDPAAKLKTCFARLTELHANGPVVLQITSSRDEASQTFPSILVWAEVASATPESLIGQEVPAKLYGQLTSGGPIYQNATPDSVQLRVTASATGQLQGQVAGMLIYPGAEEPIPIQGSFAAELISAP